MSWQAKLSNFGLRIAKSQLAKKDYQQARAFMLKYMDEQAKKAPPPSDADIRQETLGGVPCEWVVDQSALNSRQLVLYFHGGAFMVGCPDTHRDMAWRLSRDSGMKVLVVDYRLTPEHLFPAPLEDACAVYSQLLDQGYQAEDMAFAGDSAGGNMVLSVMTYLLRKAIPLPSAGLCLSPWADLSQSGDSITGNAKADAMLPPSLLVCAADVYAGERDRRDPLLSPVFGDFKDFPPLLIYVGAEEVLLDDARRIQQAAQAAAVAVEYREWAGLPHAFPVMAKTLPEGRQAIANMAAFLRKHLGRAQV